MNSKILIDFGEELKSEKPRGQEEHKKKTQTTHDAGSVGDFELGPFVGKRSLLPLSLTLARSDVSYLVSSVGRVPEC